MVIVKKTQCEEKSARESECMCDDRIKREKKRDSENENGMEERSYMERLGTAVEFSNHRRRRAQDVTSVVWGDGITCWIEQERS